MIYLDSNATTQPLPEVVEAMSNCLTEDWANPSSMHRAGTRARRLIDQSRQEVASLIGCRPRDIVFTSGGTESALLAIRGSMAANPDRTHVATSPLEHSVLRDQAARLEAQGRRVHHLKHLPGGLIDLDHLETILQRHADALALVSVMWVNNETGVVQPINEIGARCREHGVLFHTDAVQAVGRIPVDCAALNVDLLGFSAHKFHGPKGVGGLYVSRGVNLHPEQVGGSQEGGLRGGTENVPGIVGIGQAARLAGAWLSGDGPDQQAALRDEFEGLLAEKIPTLMRNGMEAPRTWSTANLGFPRLGAEGLLMILSERGVCASAGAACASGSLEPSPVLLAMGIPEEVAHGSIRFSLSRFTSRQEIEEAAGIIIEAVEVLGRSMQPLS